MGLLDFFRPKWKNSNPKVRYAAILERVPAGYGKPRLKPRQLAKLALTDSDESVRWLALETLSEKNQDVIAQVVRAAKTPEVRNQAFYRLYDPALFFKVITAEPRLPFPNTISTKTYRNIIADERLPSDFKSQLYKSKGWMDKDSEIKGRDKRHKEILRKLEKVGDAWYVEMGAEYDFRGDLTSYRINDLKPAGIVEIMNNIKAFDEFYRASKTQFCVWDWGCIEYPETVSVRSSSDSIIVRTANSESVLGRNRSDGDHCPELIFTACDAGSRGDAGQLTLTELENVVRTARSVKSDLRDGACISISDINAPCGIYSLPWDGVGPERRDYFVTSFYVKATFDHVATLYNISFSWYWRAGMRASDLLSFISIIRSLDASYRRPSGRR